MKLQHQILGLGLAGALAAGLAGGVGLWNTFRLATAFEQATSVTLALQRSQDADMMHDAIRGDVLLALLSAQTKDTKGLEEAQKDLVEHAETFTNAIAEMKTFPISAETRDASAAIDGALKSYVESAKVTQKAAITDLSDAIASYPEFQKSFKVLEGAMDKMSKTIEKDVETYNDAAKESVNSAKVQEAALVLLAALLLAIASIWLSRTLSRPMDHAAKVADQMANGDLNSHVDQIGSDESRKLLAALANMQSNLAQVVSNVRHGSESVALASAEIAQGNQDLSSRTESQASALEETAASMEQLGSQVRQNADSARQANQLAMSASTVAVQGGEVVGQVVQTMKGINESSRKIADIISVIDGIAFQTNILALNAAVEAARAGEQGRGFAVVASEVRSLAGRSADAAKEIKSLISASVERVEQGTALVDKAGETMTEVVSSIRRVTDIMGEISAASSEQAAGVAQVGEAVTQMDQATQQNAALVEQMAAAASSLKSQAAELVQAVAVFKLSGSAGTGSSAGSGSSTSARAPQLRSSTPKGIGFAGTERREGAASTAKPTSKPLSKPLPKPAPKPATSASARPGAPAAKPAPLPAPAKTAKATTPAGGDDDWETF
jgi:methyl-accepting chemotaxis protein